MSSLLVLEGGCWRVRFVRRGDRYAHVIEVRDGGGYAAILESVEGATDDAWPASPPLQDLHLEERGGAAQVALLVGRAARSHWSMSIEQKGDILVFDAACRVGEQPGWLGTSYRLLQSPPDSSLANCGLGVALEAGQGVCDVRLEQALSKIVLSVQAPANDCSQTVRWSYRLVQR